ncbi:hypothetical protein BLNAU_18351 [Blattamonas nauphoetae]|uniref:Uncharacterized protein n=1 Tax=Blattamonas nauphoetae TaxID=2049346 RepID=A0ABQ9X4Z4_9EUKA|nr:hypothetical protein BLNAU_18351 [Blattamonas nauphoetae]
MLVRWHFRYCKDQEPPDCIEHDIRRHEHHVLADPMCSPDDDPSLRLLCCIRRLEAVAQVSLNVSFTNCEGSSAPKGSGGLIYVSGDSQLDFCDVSSEETSTGECGGRFCLEIGLREVHKLDKRDGDFILQFHVGSEWSNKGGALTRMAIFCSIEEAVSCWPRWWLHSACAAVDVVLCVRGWGREPPNNHTLKLGGTINPPPRSPTNRAMRSSQPAINRLPITMSLSAIVRERLSVFYEPVAPKEEAGSEPAIVSALLPVLST